MRPTATTHQARAAILFDMHGAIEHHLGRTGQAAVALLGQCGFRVEGDPGHRGTKRRMLLVWYHGVTLFLCVWGGREPEPWLRQTDQAV